MPVSRPVVPLVDCDIHNELTPGALRIAMERPNAEERWRKRLPVFALARDTEPGAGSDT